MYNNESLSELIKLAEKSNEQLSIQMRIYEEKVNLAKKNATEEEVKKIEQSQVLYQKVIALSKQGKMSEVDDLIKSFK